MSAAVREFLSVGMAEKATTPGGAGHRGCHSLFANPVGGGLAPKTLEPKLLRKINWPRWAAVAVALALLCGAMGSARASVFIVPIRVVRPGEALVVGVVPSPEASETRRVLAIFILNMAEKIALSDTYWHRENFASPAHGLTWLELGLAAPAFHESGNALLPVRRVIEYGLRRLDFDQVGIARPASNIHASEFNLKFGRSGFSVGEANGPNSYFGSMGGVEFFAGELNLLRHDVGLSIEGEVSEASNSGEDDSKNSNDVVSSDATRLLRDGAIGAVIVFLVWCFGKYPKTKGRN